MHRIGQTRGPTASSITSWSLGAHNFVPSISFAPAFSFVRLHYFATCIRASENEQLRPLAQRVRSDSQSESAHVWRATWKLFLLLLHAAVQPIVEVKVSPVPGTRQSLDLAGSG